MSFPAGEAFRPSAMAMARVAEVVVQVVTEAPPVNSIVHMAPRTPQMLTKRRAVDFCRVATAICSQPLHAVA